jgi:predicted Zn-dependent protease
MGLVYLVEAKTGKQTLVRDVDMVGTPLALMGNILSAGDDSRAHDMTAGVPVSVTTPSLLLYDVELQRAETKPEKSPILPPPPAP